MRLLTFLSSTALATALITTSIMVSDARAQKGVVLEPSTDWAITQIDGQGGAGAYCALARRFKQDTVLTLARNSNAETSFALDFQRPKLDTSKAMSVTLDPGAGQQRIYDVRPVSNQAFVIRLGHDESFFAALEKTGHLRVEAGTQSYSFNLADIDTGQFRLDSCLAAMVAPAAGDEMPGDAPALAEGDAKSFKQDVNGLRRQIQELKEENLRLSGLLEHGSSSEPMADAVAAQRTAQDEAALNARIADLESQNNALRTSLENMQTSNKLTTVRAESAEQSADAGDASGQEAELRAEIDRLMQDNTRLREVAGTDAEAMLAKLSADNRRLQEQLDAGAKTAAAGTDTKALTDKIAALEAQNQQLKTSAASIAAANAGGAEAEQQIAALKTENAALQKTIAEKETAQALTTEIEAQVEALKATNAELTSKLAAAQQESTASADTKLAEYEAENKNLKSMLDKKGVDAGLLEQLRQKIGEMETENRLLQETAGKAQIDFETQKRAEIAALQSQLSAQQSVDGDTAEAKQLQQNIAGLTAQIEQKDLQLVEASKASVDLAALKAKNAELEQKIAAASTSTAGQEQLAALEAKVTELETKNATLKTELDAAASAPAPLIADADLQKVKDELLQAQTENTELKAQIAAAATPSTELQAALAENETLKAQVAGAQTLSTKLGTLQKENEALKLAAASQGAAGTELTTAQEAAKLLVAENEQLKAKVASLEAAAPAADQSAQLAALQEENKKTAAALEKALADALGYQSQITEKDKLLASAQQEKQELMASLEQKGGAHADLASLQTQIEGLKTENETLLLRVAELESVPAPVVAAAEPENVATISKLEADNASLKSELEKAQADLKSAATLAPESDQRIAELERKLQQAEQKLAEAPKAPEPAIVAEATQEPVVDAPAEPQQAAQPAQPEPPQDELAEVASPAPKPLVPEEPAVIEQPVAAEVVAAAEIPAAEVGPMQPAPADAMIDGRPYSAAQAMEAKMARELEEQEALKSPEVQPQELEAATPPEPQAAKVAAEVASEELPPVAAAMSEDPYEEIVAEAPAEVELMPEAAQPNPQVAAVTPQASQLRPIDKEAVMAPESSREVGPLAAGTAVQDVLEAAHIVPGGTVRRVDRASDAQKSVYQWNAENVYGSAEEQQLGDANQFDTHVKEYLEKTEQRCKGDFAIMPDNSVQQGDTRIDSYEIACVGGSVSSAAALIFYNNGDTFTAVAHEAPAEDMDAAMTLRDRLIETLSGGYEKQASLPQFTKRKDG